MTLNDWVDHFDSMSVHPHTQTVHCSFVCIAVWVCVAAATVSEYCATDGLAFWGVLAVALLAGACLLCSVCLIVHQALSSNLDVETYRIALLCAIIMLTLIFCFPLLFFLARLQVVSLPFEMVAWPLIDILAKVAEGIMQVILATKHSRAALAKILRARAASRQLKEAGMHAREVFMRYILHETKGPLNILTLGLTDLKEGQTSTTRFAASPRFFPTISPSNTATLPLPDCQDWTAGTAAGSECTALSHRASVAAPANWLLDTLITNASIVSKLMLDFQTLESLEANTVEVTVVPISLVKDVVAPSWAAFVAAAQQKSVHLQLDCDDATPRVLTDPLYLRQVIAHLVSNAIKFTPPGGSVKVHIFSSSESPGLERVTITVADSGPGLEAKQLDLLFKPFNHIATASKTSGGTGLGLVITKHVVALLQGTISVTSSLGEGATFTIILDLQHAPTALEVTPPPAPPAPAERDVPVAVSVSQLQLLARSLPRQPARELFSEHAASKYRAPAGASLWVDCSTVGDTSKLMGGGSSTWGPDLLATPTPSRERILRHAVVVDDVAVRVLLRILYPAQLLG